MLAIVIGGIATVALDRYLLLAEQTRNIRFEMLASHFATGAANARANWIIRRHTQDAPPLSSNQQMELGDQVFYFSSQGWPLSTFPIHEKSFNPRKIDCYHLWMALLQNPPPIAQDPQKKGKKEYYLTTEKGACRYYWNKEGTQDYYFEYHPLHGLVRLVIPE